MFAAVLRNEITWFDADGNASARVTARLVLDAQNMRVVAVVPHEPFLFAASIHEKMTIFLDHGEFRHFRQSIVTECYFPFTVQFFGGILWGRKLSVVFYGDHDLSVLPNQFSLIKIIVNGASPHWRHHIVCEPRNEKSEFRTAVQYCLGSRHLAPSHASLSPSS
jgi:hypothetical protein